MTRKEFNRQMLEAGMVIANKKQSCICSVIEDGWQRYVIARMFNPRNSVWWGWASMGVHYDSQIARNARLLGIAFMMTIPDDMINPQPANDMKTKIRKI